MIIIMVIVMVVMMVMIEIKLMANVGVFGATIPLFLFGAIILSFLLHLAHT